MRGNVIIWDCSANNRAFDLERSSCTNEQRPSSSMGRTSGHMRHRSLVSAIRPGLYSMKSHPWITISSPIDRGSGCSTTPPHFAGSQTILWHCSGCPLWTTCSRLWLCPCRRRTDWGGRAWLLCCTCSLTAMYRQTGTDTSRSSWSTFRCSADKFFLWAIFQNTECMLHEHQFYNYTRSSTYYSFVSYML